MPLNDTRIKNKKPGNSAIKMADGGGLYIEIKPTGSKLWRYRYRIDGKENIYALGSYPDLSLQDARTDLLRLKDLVKKGIHPIHQRKIDEIRKSLENRNTFKVIALEWIEQNKPHWSGVYTRQTERALAAHTYPKIGTLPIREVTPAHLLEILKSVEKKAPTVAILLRQWLSGIYRYAISTLRADYDPASSLKGALKRPKVQHHKPLESDEIPVLLEKLNTYGGYGPTVIAMKLLLYLFVRPGELRAAEWSEFNMDKGEWRIPAERMKMREIHIVPLPEQAVQLLSELHTFTGGRTYLFPNLRRPNSCMTGTTLNRVLERMGYGGRFSSHGFRATASTILNELGYRSDIIERQLAHAERNKSRASYNQAQYMAERRLMMQNWAEYIENLKQGSKVIKGKFGRG